MSTSILGRCLRSLPILILMPPQPLPQRWFSVDEVGAVAATTTLLLLLKSVYNLILILNSQVDQTSESSSSRATGGAYCHTGLLRRI